MYINFQHTNKELTHYDTLNHFASFHVRIIIACAHPTVTLSCDIYISTELPSCEEYHDTKQKPIQRSTAELWPFVHHYHYVKKEDGEIVPLLFQSEASISGLDGCNDVWDHSSQNLMVSKMVCVVFS